MTAMSRLAHRRGQHDNRRMARRRTPRDEERHDKGRTARKRTIAIPDTDWTALLSLADTRGLSASATIVALIREATENDG